MTQEVIDRLLIRIKTVIFTLDPVVPLFCGAIQDPQGDLKKHSIFKRVSNAEKVRKPAPKASKKQKKSTFATPKKTFAKTWLCNTFQTQTLF